MGFLSSFIHNEALAEMLIEGHNPYAQRKLETSDVDAIRQQMHSREVVQAYVIGRIVGSGRGVWALTSEAVYLRDPSLRAVRRVALADITGFDTERGRFGHSVRLSCNEGHFSMYGADREMVQLMHRALSAQGVQGRFDERQARQVLWRQPAPVGWAQDCVLDARRRLSFA